jgi:hypothetical protein
LLQSGAACATQASAQPGGSCRPGFEESRASHAMAAAGASLPLMSSWGWLPGVVRSTETRAPLNGRPANFRWNRRRC